MNYQRSQTVAGTNHFRLFESSGDAAHSSLSLPAPGYGEKQVQDAITEARKPEPALFVASGSFGAALVLQYQ